jgi:hypothetical protein
MSQSGEWPQGGEKFTKAAATGVCDGHKPIVFRQRGPGNDLAARRPTCDGMGAKFLFCETCI